MGLGEVVIHAPYILLVTLDLGCSMFPFSICIAVVGFAMGVDWDSLATRSWDREIGVEERRRTEGFSGSAVKP